MWLSGGVFAYHTRLRVHLSAQAKQQQHKKITGEEGTKRKRGKPRLPWARPWGFKQALWNPFNYHVCRSRHLTHSEYGDDDDDDEDGDDNDDDLVKGTGEMTQQLLFLQKTRVWFPASTYAGQLTTAFNSSCRVPMPSSPRYNGFLG